MKKTSTSNENAALVLLTFNDRQRNIPVNVFVTLVLKYSELYKYLIGGLISQDFWVKEHETIQTASRVCEWYRDMFRTNEWFGDVVLSLVRTINRYNCVYVLV